MTIVRNIVDFIAVLFLFYGTIHFNMVLLSTTGWAFIVFYAFTVVLNAFVTFSIINMKYYVIDSVMAQYDCSQDNRNDADEVKEILMKSIQLSDLIEFSFGPIWRYIGDMSIVICLFLNGTSELAIGNTHFKLLEFTLNDTIEWMPVNIDDDTTSKPHTRINIYDLDHFLLYSAYFLIPLMIIFVIVKRFEHFALPNLIGLIAVIVGCIQYVLSINQYNFLLATRDQISKGLKGISVFANASLQFAVMVLPIENNMKNRRYFRLFFIASILFSLGVILMIGVSLWYYLPEDVEDIMPVMLYLLSNKIVRIIMLIGNAVFYLPLVFPCITLMERRFFSNTKRNRLLSRNEEFINGDENAHEIGHENEFVNILDPFHVRRSGSIFRRLRQSGQNTFITRSEIVSDLSDRHYPRTRYLLRVVYFLLQWLSVWACVSSTIALFISMGLGFVSNVFIGYILPATMMVLRRWNDTGIVMKIASVLVILAGIAMTALGYFIDYSFYIYFFDSKISE